MSSFNISIWSPIHLSTGFEAIQIENNKKRYDEVMAELQVVSTFEVIGPPRILYVDTDSGIRAWPRSEILDNIRDYNEDLQYDPDGPNTETDSDEEEEWRILLLEENPF